MRRGSLLAALVLLGCRASFVERKRRVSGPVPEVGLIDPGGGHVRYALKGPRFLVDRRKQDALSKMAKYCGSPSLFRVVKEYTREDIETPYQAQDLDVTVAQNIEHYKLEVYRHIEFECLKAP